MFNKSILFCYFVIRTFEHFSVTISMYVPTYLPTGRCNENNFENCWIIADQKTHNKSLTKRCLSQFVFFSKILIPLLHFPSRLLLQHIYSVLPHRISIWKSKTIMMSLNLIALNFRFHIKKNILLWIWLVLLKSIVNSFACKNVGGS